jgi:uncharacterized protein (TIGR01370 family)
MSGVTRLVLSLLIAGLMTISASLYAQETTEPPLTARDYFREIDDYIVYYGEGRAEDLEQFDAAIIQPETLPVEDLQTWTDDGTQAVVYLSVGEVEPYRDWYNDGRVSTDWILGHNPDWDSFYINANETGWQDLMIEIAAEYLAQGFDGIFLDTVDTVDLFPDTESGMIELIARLRENFPDAILVQNRGFTILDDTVDLIDAVMFEDLSTTYDFDNNTYEQINPEENQELIDSLVEFHEDTGLVVLALDYVDPEGAEAIQATESAREIAQSYGFISYIAEITLQEIPDYGGE